MDRQQAARKKLFKDLKKRLWTRFCRRNQRRLLLQEEIPGCAGVTKKLLRSIEKQKLKTGNTHVIML